MTRPGDIAELDGALANVRQRSLDTIAVTRNDFPLPRTTSSSRTSWAHTSPPGGGAFMMAMVLIGDEPSLDKAMAARR
jgi:hypothetical protein